MQELTSVAELTAFFEDYQRNCVGGEIDDSRLRFENTLKFQALLVTRRICSAANIFKQSFYRERLINVAMDLKKGTIFRDNYEIFVNIFLLYMEEVISCKQQNLDGDLLDRFTATLANLTMFFRKVVSNQSPGFIGRKQLSYDNLLATVKSISMFAQLFVEPTLLSTVTFGKFERLAYSCVIKNLGELLYQLFYVLTCSTEELTKLEWQDLEKHILYFSRSLFAERTDTFLHVAVRKDVVLLGELKKNHRTLS
jgi:hypothetical protein